MRARRHLVRRYESQTVGAAVTPCSSASSGGGGINGHAPSSGEVSLSAEVTPAAAAKPRAFAESTATTQHAL